MQNFVVRVFLYLACNSSSLLLIFVVVHSKRIRILLRIKQFLPKDTQHNAAKNVSGQS